MNIMDVVVAYDPFFVQKPNVVRLMALSNVQKCIVALRMVAYGVASNMINEYARL
jgi:hypothetical protein